MSKIVSFVLPVYKNEASLQELYLQIKSVMTKDVKGLSYTLVFVNDGSPDNSIDVLKKLVAKLKSKYRAMSKLVPYVRIIIATVLAIPPIKTFNGRRNVSGFNNSPI